MTEDYGIQTTFTFLLLEFPGHPTISVTGEGVCQLNREEADAEHFVQALSGMAKDWREKVAERVAEEQRKVAASVEENEEYQ